MSDTVFEPSRRTLLLSGGAAVTAAFTGPVAAMAARVERTEAALAAGCAPADASSLVASPYGPVAPVKDISTGLPLIQLPAGFTYKSYGWRGDTMSDGLPTPAAHDGMGVVVSRRVGRSTEIILVRNHEQSTSSDPSRIIGAGRDNVAKHDVGLTGTSYQIGGNTNLVFRDGQWVESYASFGGLNRPCAGGSSTWGSWLSNEEIRSNNVSSTGKRHGYIFEIPADTSLNAASTEPLRDMGRMSHEASAIDPATGYWYLTEDQGNANTLYRFLPNDLQGGLGSLHAGGRLQGLKVRNVVNADLRFPTLCQEFSCEWVDIADPDLDGASIAITGVSSSVSASGPYRQAYANGAAIFGANEGCWVANGVVFFTDKATGTSPVARAGIIWALDLATMTLKAIFVSRDRVVGNSPDNICISPRGGLLFNEDGGNSSPQSAPIPAQDLKVLTPQGNSYVFARHNYNFTRAQLDAAGKPLAPAGDNRNTEWAGSCFSPDGRILFVNLYTPGITLAITGPWTKGNL
jgi:secreted PhoX family phosphatase